MATAQTVNIDKAMELYHTLRGLQSTQLSHEKLGQVVSEQLKNGAVKDVKFAERSFLFLHRVATGVNEADWRDFVTEGSLPPLKLTAEEMEMVRGGLVMSALIAGIGIGLALVGIAMM